ncbi:MAG: hypothetical protein A2Z59_08110 [Nitrospinae bacterium RIFCSPLOWO2_02_39_17]|nr:MAG: hypothetical protein A2W53_06790 [Nitrospinae bacterium RIFCSPHIGHO2_02_39_11]OGW04732.1 MAG: hypothetical protein A2Z59_08110 [Nitrospinae bacterium RIFCSPLOWO2_02_39_17]OGW09815.1 MAG: hypothetical protein A2W75_02055 [Nitrospinae bacterium RIFCSPLOWO2_12_39_15]
MRGQFNVTNLIIIPIYNENRYIEGVLEKVRENTNSDILVVDNGSTDNSLKILSSLKDTIKGIKLII